MVESLGLVQWSRSPSRKVCRGDWVSCCDNNEQGQDLAGSSSPLNRSRKGTGRSVAAKDCQQAEQEREPSPHPEAAAAAPLIS